MVGRGGGDDVAVACYLAGEARDGARDWMGVGSIGGLEVEMEGSGPW